MPPNDETKPPTGEAGKGLQGTRTLTPSEIEQLRQKTKRDNASSRARYAKVERPEELAAPAPRGEPEESQVAKDARRERLLRGTRRTIDYVRAELPKMLSPEDIEELRKDGDTPLVRAALEWQAKQKTGK